MSYHIRKGREEAALVLFLFFFVLSTVKTDEKIVGEQGRWDEINFFLSIYYQRHICLSQKWLCLNIYVLKHVWNRNRHFKIRQWHQQPLHTSFQRKIRNRNLLKFKAHRLYSVKAWWTTIPIPCGGEIQRQIFHVRRKITIRHDCQHTYIQRGLIINNGELHNVWIHGLGKNNWTGQIKSKPLKKHDTYLFIYS